MHLQSLELFGFKSFPDKTVFNFHEGITAIVGPNGCGKSNLLDAVRWVLGEQSAKSLRGGEMADVIFNGTDTRKPLSFAEVSLTLTDCATELGVDWHDIRVTRRVYRDGNSEYLLNKTLCRLRDIQSLFADTGVARSAYSMMEQGKIDLILSSRPEDRRAVFEEAAGITKYKGQKREALRKLEATEANLLRIGDIIKEVKRQIGSLQRQAGKARRYQALLADLQVLDTHHSRKELESFERELAECRAEIERITKDESAARAKIESRENELTDTRHSVDEIDTQIADGRSEMERLQSEIAAHRSRIEFNRQRAEEIAELIERSKGEIAAVEAKRDQQQTQMTQVNAGIEKSAQLLRTKQTELASLTALLANLRAERIANDEELQTLQLTSAKNESRISDLEDNLSGIALRREATNEHLHELDTAISEARDAHGKAEAAVTTARAATDTEQKNADLLLAQTQAAEETLHHHQQLLAEAEKNLIAIERALAEKESRLEVLEQLNEEGEGLAQGSQAVLKGLDDPKRIQSALAGALVAQLDVVPKFVAAVEAALGRNLHTIVLQNAKIASHIIATLTEKKLGQTALFIPELSEPAPPPKQTGLPEHALAWAVEIVNAPESLRPLVQNLLHDVAIFEDLDQAIRFKENAPRLAAATLAGEFISVEGIIFGGSSGAQKESLLERKARISILAAEHSVVSARRATLRQKRDEAKSAQDKTATYLEETRAKHRAADLGYSTAANKISLLERELEEATRKVDNFVSEKTTLRQQIEEADTRIAELEKELADARKSFAEQQDRHQAVEGKRKEAIAQEEKASEQLNELRLALATEQQRHDNLIAQRQPMSAREAELAETINARRTDIANFEKRLATQASESKSAEAAIDRENERRDEVKTTVAGLSDKRAEHLSLLNEAETELRSARNLLNGLHDRRATQQVRESQLQMKIGNLAEHVERRYHVDLRSFAPDHSAFEKILRVQLKRREGGSSAPPLDANIGGEAASHLIPRSESAIHLEQIIGDLTRQLDNMGPVNLEAVQEYDELEERHRFLEAQNNDLTTSRRELLDVIARINSTTQKLFSETFAQVRVNFREMFAELFGGGRADLALMDESDLLNCGIEITAKPPGKQLQSVSLLSGGERTMTAVALLFAIYMVRPSPFCVLDELDAPLDESNINRFIRVLERFVAQSQFIIITHNKRTIAKADILYGVTMEERGVSKLVGMKLAERPEAIADRPPESLAGHSTQRQFAMAENGDAEAKSSFAAR